MRVCYDCGMPVACGIWPAEIEDFDIFGIMRVTITCPDCGTRYQAEIYAGKFTKLEDDDEDTSRVG